MPLCLQDETTNNFFYKPFEFPPGAGGDTRPSRAATLPPAIMDWGTTYRNHYVPKQAPDKLPVGELYGGGGSERGGGVHSV